MKVSELISLLKDMNQDADVMFDTEAQTYDVHLVPVDSAYAEGPEAGLDREIVYLCEDAPHRNDDRDDRIAALESQLSRLLAVQPHDDEELSASLYINSDEDEKRLWERAARRQSKRIAELEAECANAKIEAKRHLESGRMMQRRAESAESALAASRSAAESYRREHERTRQECADLRRALERKIDAVHEQMEIWKECERLREKIANQSERIRVLEGPTNHAGGLRSRADDAGRVERAVKAVFLGWCIGNGKLGKLLKDEVEELVRDVLAAADKI